MNPHSRIPLYSSLLTLLLLVSCSAWHPARFASVQEAYVGGEHLAEPSPAPVDSRKKALFDVPYEDMYRAASVSASQAQMSIEWEDKAKGQILAVRVTKGLMPQKSFMQPGNRRPQDKYFFYSIVVRERGPRSTEVSITAKTQGRCITESVDLGGDKAECLAYSVPHWATGDDNSQQELTQFMT